MAVVDIAGLSERGRREQNQDRIFSSRSPSGSRAVIALADGMGGHSDGDVAAEIAIGKVKSFAEAYFLWSEVTPEAITDALESALSEAHASIAALVEGEDREAGTTLVCAVVYDDRYVAANVGDSRVYFLNGRDGWPITQDQTQVQDLVREGLLDPAAAVNSPYAHLLTSSLGGRYRIETSPGRGLWGFCEETYVLALTSDGLHNFTDPATMASVLGEDGGLEKGCERLCREVFERGSKDNISIVAAKVNPGGSSSQARASWRSWWGFGRRGLL